VAGGHTPKNHETAKPFRKLLSQRADSIHNGCLGQTTGRNLAPLGPTLKNLETRKRQAKSPNRTADSAYSRFLRKETAGSQETPVDATELGSLGSVSFIL